MKQTGKRFRLISCEILFREVCLCAALSGNTIDIEFMEKGLHDMGAGAMSEKLQRSIDETNKEKYDALLLVYGLCSNGTAGLSSEVPLVIPRVHDCIALLFGSRDIYAEYSKNNASAYYLSTGWMERDSRIFAEGSIPSQLRMNRTYREYAEIYGEENAEYLMEQFGDLTANYDRYTYIDTGMGDQGRFEETARKAATEKGWKFEKIKGSIGMIQKLMDGDWDDEDMLVVPPGQKTVPSYDCNIIGHQVKQNLK